jgi:RES domain-containing protein
MNIKKVLLPCCLLGLFVATGCGPVDEQQIEEIISGVAQTAAAGVTFVPETPVPTSDVNVIVQQTFAAMTVQAGNPQPAASTPPAPNATTGNIAGQLNYPADSIPAMYVVAYQVGTQNHPYLATMPGQNAYQIANLQPGVYHVVAYTIGGGGFPAGLAGGYTQAVPCGLSVNCTDHTLIDVTVVAGQTASGVNPFDWYAPQGTFPPFPGGGAAVGTSTSTLPPAVANGSIAGKLMYPANSIPSLRIVAFRVGTSSYYYMDTALGQSSYQLDNLPPGVYHVVAYVRPGGGFTGGLSGGYTQMVPCGLQYGCNDHSLIDVTVTAGHLTTGVDPNDYYADPGAFPPNPVP